MSRGSTDEGARAVLRDCVTEFHQVCGQLLSARRPVFRCYRYFSKNGVTWAIAKANGLYNVNYIRAGQSLYIPGY